MAALFSLKDRKSTRKANDRAELEVMERPIIVPSSKDDGESVSSFTGENRTSLRVDVFARMDLVDAVWVGSAPIVFGAGALTQAPLSFFLSAAVFYVIGWPVHKVTHAVADRLAHRIRDG